MWVRLSVAIGNQTRVRFAVRESKLVAIKVSGCHLVPVICVSVWAGLRPMSGTRLGLCRYHPVVCRGRCALWTSGPRRSRAPPMTAPPAKMPAIHHIAVS